MMPHKRQQETPQLSRRCFSGAGASTARAQPERPMFRRASQWRRALARILRDHDQCF
jgi:hypothetical protein